MHAAQLVLWIPWLSGMIVACTSLTVLVYHWQRRSTRVELSGAERKAPHDALLLAVFACLCLPALLLLVSLALATSP